MSEFYLGTWPQKSVIKKDVLKSSLSDQINFHSLLFGYTSEFNREHCSSDVTYTNCFMKLSLLSLAPSKSLSLLQSRNK